MAPALAFPVAHPEDRTGTAPGVRRRAGPAVDARRKPAEHARAHASRHVVEPRERTLKRAPLAAARRVRWSSAALRSRCAALLAACAAALTGCAAPPAVPTGDRMPLGPADPYAVKSAALLWPGASSALLVTDSPLAASAGTYALRWRGRCAGEEMPAGRFGRPAPGSPNILWRAEGSRAVWTLEMAPVAVDASRRTDDTGPRKESQVVASIELTVVPLADGPADVELVATLGPDSAYPVPSREGDLAPVLAWRRGAEGVPVAIGPTEARGADLRLTRSVTRARPARWRFLLAASPLASPQLREVMRATHASCVTRADRDLTGLLSSRALLQVGDAELEQAMDEALLVLVGCSEISSGDKRPIGNPFQYRDTWIRDAARQASALAQWGLHGPARDAVHDLVEFQVGDGWLLSQSGQLDGTGQVLWGVEEVFGRAADAPGAEAFAGIAERAWRWCEQRRAMVRERAPNFAGLMPPADPRDNELASGYLFGTDAWTLAGYRAGAALVERAGNRATADSMRRSADAYATLLRSRIERLGGRVPPRWDGPARDWGNLTALYPTRAIPLEGARRARLLAPIEHAGPGPGLAHYGTQDTVHLYLGADLALDALLLGRPELWRATLASMLAARTGTGGLPEVYCASTRAFGWNLPPHTTSAAALLTLVRQGLVFDAFGDTLRLTLGTLPAWWDAGGSLERAPTRWGPMNLTFRRAGDAVSWRWSAVPVWTELTLPPGARRVFAAGEDLAGSETRILVPPGRDHAEVRCRFD